MNYKNYLIENKNNIWIIFDEKGNQLCDMVGCELIFNSLEEAKAYIDDLFC